MVDLENLKTETVHALSVQAFHGPVLTEFKVNFNTATRTRKLRKLWFSATSAQVPRYLLVLEESWQNLKTVKAVIVK